MRNYLTIIFPPDKDPDLAVRSKNRGQVFVEFVLLILVMISVSMIMLKVINNNIGDRWKKMVETISSPTSSKIEFY
ncbi:MAG: hypothetical protein HN353_02460 [Bdellovibrionales bacterium]|nr:hypothetical protein [Bdellovibrionales bacterium]MBT3525549.1 hypothetical protein [Bdellovibrionales bacterium]MBT7668092.1 hypothetical protein [Bdellovibrionales bacterium]MBT7767362.1 hypothetical protein [Bdellovibrionales bacterium]